MPLSQDTVCPAYKIADACTMKLMLPWLELAVKVTGPVAQSWTVLR